MALVEARDLVREYRMGEERVRALDGASLTLDGGQFVSVIGPSGAGKSTLLHILGALDTPTSGTITVDGVDLGTLDDDAASSFRRHRVGFIFQFFNLVPTLSAWENVALPMLLDSKSLGSAKPRAVELMERVGLGNRIDHRPSELSGGQMQRVAIARSLIMDPKILLADEPTGNLDSKTGADVLALLAEVAHDEPDRLVLMVTHADDAADFSDRVITVRDGKIHDPGNVAAAGREPQAPTAGQAPPSRPEIPGPPPIPGRPSARPVPGALWMTGPIPRVGDGGRHRAQ
ncbi:putative ABC transporter ATP-binding protein [Gordonia hirsuta DSM 44140 = NBRC 16056]|uniref:Putative ABC transporter ATP-binding protein n=1 Tax=Gordonia hirsuta DSM 44140 = NBRC 16056 TaxID=1121927 RepID=L7L7D0_9ACTN|nr:ABC transporter ATP-binding protein [Gordonia hirsuta]GAC56839.1 putative ABC transporter ATP-binding protein [Gordonia hirsuta DSM 44140 = NBRC 16056]